MPKHMASVISFISLRSLRGKGISTRNGCATADIQRARRRARKAIIESGILENLQSVGGARNEAATAYQASVNSGRAWSVQSTLHSDLYFFAGFKLDIAGLSLINKWLAEDCHQK